MVTEVESARQHLSLAIIQVLESFPHNHRTLFARVHYGGESIEAVARSMGIEAAEARRTLASCERKLHDALRSFRPYGEPAASMASC